MAAYYNEIEPYAAEWLRNLIAAGHIAPGDVDTRDIRDVRPDDLRGYDQCHFFAGVGGWSLALRLAGWPDDRPVWTGSCPCQPFSAAGRGAGFADERHLWPHFHWLIEQRRPGVVFGEQVASKDGLGWLDLVQADLEGAGYAVGSDDLCAAGVGAPHIRQRLWWVADAGGERRQQVAGSAPGDEETNGRAGRLRCEPDGDHVAPGHGATGGLADGSSEGLEGCDAGALGRERAAAERGGGAGGPADTDSEQHDRSGVVGPSGRSQHSDGGATVGGLADDNSSGRPSDLQRGGATELFGEGQLRGSWPRPERSGANFRPGPTNGFWRDADWLLCRDGKWRPVEPGTFPLAHGIPNRVGRLRAYGNAIVPQAAAEFIAAYLDVVDGPAFLAVDDLLS